MTRPVKLDTDYYVIADDFRLIDFNDNVAARYKGIARGDLCYAATMKRDSPCPHCPIAGNSDKNGAVYYDPFYRDWVEALFCEIGGGRYAVTCRPAEGDAGSIFRRLKRDELPITGAMPEGYDADSIGIIGGYCEEGFPLYYVNDRMAAMLGYDSREDLEAGIDGKVVNTIHPDDLPQVSADLGDHYYAGMKYETTYRMPRKDGTWFWTIDRGEVVKTADGRLAIISACLDVTREREQQEARKREREAAASKDKIWSDITRMIYGHSLTVRIRDGRYTCHDGEGPLQLPIVIAPEGSYEDLYRNFIAHTDKAYREKADRLLSLDSYRGQALSPGFAGIEELRVYGPDGAAIWQEVTVIAGVDNAGEPILHILARDVTEAHDRADTRAQLEIARAASEAKTAFLFNMSHDIRTPMNAIVGYTALLGKSLSDEAKARDYLGKIETANHYLVSLINNVLEMARIESGRLHLDENPANVDEVWDELWSLFEPLTAGKGLRFERHIDVVHRDILVDGTKLRQIFLNLISNAVKYTPSGGTVTMSVTELPSEDPECAVFRTVIEDTGIGISSQFLPHVFDEFSRERTSTESRVAGTGLGMAIVKGLVDLMHGTITVDSELGQGTTFTLTLRHRIAGESAAAPASEAAGVPAEADFKGRRILLAEDNELNAEIAEAILTEAGFLVEIAPDGIDCVAMMTKAEPDYYDLVLMDIQMPHMDGYKAARIIRRLPDENKAAVPILAMTANAFEEDRQKALAEGMNGHIAKPIHIPELMAALREVLHQ